MSWTDVKSTFVAATTIGVSVGSGNFTRLRGYSTMCSGAAGGQVILSQVSAGARGTDVMTLHVPGSSGGSADNFSQGGGIRCSAGIFVTVPAATVITLFYD